MSLMPIHLGGRSELCRRVQGAARRRLRTRDLGRYAPVVDGDCGKQTIDACAKTTWALGLPLSVVNRIRERGEVSVDVIAVILSPGKRTADQKSIGKARIAHMRHEREKRAKEAAGVSEGRLKVVRLCLLAASNYAANPSAWHYLAGGKANLVFLKPTPRDWRSDCSQFASAVQAEAGLPDLGPNGPLWVNTWAMDAHLERTSKPLPADFGMYGPPGNPHHVEVFLGAAGGPGHAYVGHGSPPVDSLTPGLPTYFLRNPVGA